MKKIALSAILTLMMVGAGYSQPADTTNTDWNSGKSGGGFAEKFGTKIQKKMQEIEAKRNAPVEATQNGSLESYAKNWPAKNKVVTFRPYGNSGMLKGDRYVYIEISKGDHGYVDTITTGFYLDDDKKIKDPIRYAAYINPMYTSNKWYFPDDPFVVQYYHQFLRLYVTENSIVNYKLTDHDEVEIKSIEWISGKKGKNEANWAKEIEAFRRFGFQKYIDDEAALKQAEIDFRNQYSLENKEVKDIKVVYVDDTDKTGVAYVGKTVNFGLEVTLADGTTDKTHNLGGNLYMEDFITDFPKTQHIDDEYSNDQWGGHCHCGDAKLVLGDYAPQPGKKDVITFTVKPKYKGNASQTITLPLAYPEEINFDNPGNDIRLYAKKVKHSETGEELIMVKYGNLYKKVKIGGTIKAYASGVPGRTGRHGADCYKAYCRAENAGNGHNGGNAGNILITITKDIEDKVKFNLLANGGRGGSPGVPGHATHELGTDGSPGVRGRDGTDGYTRITVGKAPF